MNEVTKNVVEGTQQLGIFASGVFTLAVIMMIFVGVSFFLSNRSPNNKKRTGNAHFQSKQLHFAAVTLTGLGLIFVLSMGMYYYSPNNTAAESIFDACRTTLPPIITLILGFYFGQENAKTSGGIARNELEQTPGPEETTGPEAVSADATG